ncbi:MAG: PIN domain-containing protein [Myxococcota bacterium]
MSSRIAFDANILFYAMDPYDEAKRSRCASILQRAMQEMTGSVTLQTLGEFAVAVARKGVLEKSEAAASARDWADAFETVAAATHALHVALDWWRQGRLSYWDALLVATLSDHGITGLVTEDMDAGAVIGGVEIINPFDSDANRTMNRHGLAI